MGVYFDQFTTQQPGGHPRWTPLDRALKSRQRSFAPRMGPTSQITLTNSFEGGTNGVTQTTGNSGGISGNAFDATVIGSGAVQAYDNTKAAHGGVSLQLSTGVTSVSDTYSWTTSMGTQTKVWFRAYLFFTAFPTTPVRFFRCLTGSTLCAAVTVNATGNITMLRASGTIMLTSAATVPLNQWFRVEGFMICDANFGQLSFSYFATEDAQVATETQTSAATLATNAPADTYTFGISNSANIGPFWMDDVGVSNVGLLGPASTGPEQYVRPLPYRTRWAPFRRLVAGRPSFGHQEWPQGNQGIQFPLFTRQRGYSPKWAAQVRRWKRQASFFGAQEWPQGNQGVQFPLFTRQGGFSPKWAAQVGRWKRRASFFGNQEWPQGNQGVQFPLFMRQRPGYVPKWAPHVSSRRSRISNITWPSFAVPSNILNQNFDFETGTAPWSAFGGGGSETIAQSVLYPQHGTHSVLLTPDGTHANPGLWSEGNIPVSAGQTYTSQVICYSPQGWNGIQPVIWWSTASGGGNGSNVGSTVNIPAGVPTLVTVTATAPAGTQRAQMTFQATGTPPATTLFYFDIGALTGPPVIFPRMYRQIGRSPKWYPPWRFIQRRLAGHQEWPQANQGVQFPLWSRQSGYSPKWAAQVGRWKRRASFFGNQEWPQKDQSIQFSLFTRQAGRSPKWSPPYRVTKGRLFGNDLWPQGNQGVRFPLFTRQSGRSPKQWGPPKRATAARFFQPGWGQTQVAVPALMSGTGTLTASAVVTEAAATSLTGTGTLTVSGLVTQVAIVAFTGTGTLTATGDITQLAFLHATGTLTAYAQAGPSPESLWNIYLAAAAKADKSLASWNETAIAGGSSNQTGMTYTTAYEDQIAAGNAYQAWLNAYELWYPKSGI